MTTAIGGAPLLSVEGVTKSYSHSRWRRRSEPAPALRNVSVSVSRGRTLGIVGESGSGKSTLGRCILALTRPDSGAIIFEGSDVLALNRRGLSDFRRRVQPVFQDPYSSLDPRWPVGRSVRESLDSFGIGSASSRDARMLDLFDRVGLDPSFSTRLPAELSGGQRQRVGIAAALASEPQLIIADEPVSALDVSVQAQILNLFMDLQNDLGVGCVFITHDLSVVEHVSDEIAVLYRGEVVELGQTEQIVGSPVHDYTRSLLSSVPRHPPLASHPPFPRT